MRVDVGEDRHVRVAPKNATAKMNIAAVDSVGCLFLNSRRSISGCSGRKARSAKSTTNVSPIRPGTITGAAAAVPSVGIGETPNKKSASPGDSNSMPRKSNDSDGLGESFGSAKYAYISVHALIGMLIKKI